MKNKTTSFREFLITGILLLLIIANPTLGQKKKWTTNDVNQANETVTAFKNKNNKIKSFFNSAVGYAVFPSIGKGGMGIGGAYGKGTVYRRGKAIGGVRVTQITIGFQLGGQSYSEIIFFQNKESLDDFTSGNFEFSAQATAVALNARVEIDVPYEYGVAVFTMVKGGLMYEASIGGQKFKFIPPDE